MNTIDFKATAQSDSGLVQYYNQSGDVVKTYDISELDKYVEQNALSIYSVSANGCIMSDPNIIESEVDMGTEEYIDKNWLSVTEEFYIHRNPSDFISRNTPNQRRV